MQKHSIHHVDSSGDKRIQRCVYFLHLRGNDFFNESVYQGAIILITWNVMIHLLMIFTHPSYDDHQDQLLVGPIAGTESPLRKLFKKVTAPINIKTFRNFPVYSQEALCFALAGGLPRNILIHYCVRIVRCTYYESLSEQRWPCFVKKDNVGTTNVNVERVK